MMKVLAALLLTLTLAAGQSTNCPSDDRIYPCKCKLGTDNRPSIECNKLKSADQLKKAVKGLTDIAVTSLTIEDSNVGVLASDIFHDSEILTISIKNSNITKLSENRNRPAFGGLEDHLQILDIRNVFKVETGALTSLQLSHLKRLSSIVLYGNFIPNIGNNWFESGPYNLRDLHINNGNTSTVGSHAFEALEKLRTFTLSRGQISELSRDMLPQPANLLERIDLSSNRIKSLPHDIFTKMPVLEALYLGNNLLSTIDEVTFATIWSKLVYANFDGNPIQCDHNIKWIYKYRTPENFRGRCSGPPNLRNRDLTSLTLSDFEED